MEAENIIVLFCCTTFFGYLILRDALKEIFKLSVGKKNYRKVIKQQTFGNRITLNYIKKHAKTNKKLCKILLLINYLYISLMIIFLIIMLFSSKILFLLKIAKIILAIKVLILDIPLILFFFIKTGHDKKHGGVMWKL